MSLLNDKKEKQENANVIKQPKIITYFILIFTFLFIGLLIFSFLVPEIMFGEDKPIIGVVIFLSIMLAICLLIILNLLRWKIDFYDSYFVFRSSFRKRKIKFEDVEVREVGNFYWLYMNNKHLLILTHYQSNYDILGEAILNYQKENNSIINKEIRNIIKPTAILWISIILMYTFIVLISLLIYDIVKIDIITYLLLGLNFTIIILIIFYKINWRIKFDDKTIQIRKTLGYTKTYDINRIYYKEISFTGSNNDLIIYNENNKKIAILINSLHHNLSEFKEGLISDNKL